MVDIQYSCTVRLWKVIIAVFISTFIVHVSCMSECVAPNRSAAAWEDSLLKAMKDRDFGSITVARFVSRTLETELENNTNSVVPFFGVTVTIMVLFSVASVMMSDWVRTKPWLGLLGVVSAALACVAAFGFLIYFGVEFIGINMAAPFLMLGEY